MMKNEVDGDQIVEFVGLRSKLYSFRKDVQGCEEERSKGKNNLRAISGLSV